jgi:hypothetical protein
MCRLSLAWGKSQTEIEQNVSARDVDEMRKFYREDPWGSRRDNMHAAFIASVIANVYRAKGRKAISYEDFMLLDREQHGKRKSGQLLDWMKSVAKPKKNKNGK